MTGAPPACVDCTHCTVREPSLPVDIHLRALMQHDLGARMLACLRTSLAVVCRCPPHEYGVPACYARSPGRVAGGRFGPQGWALYQRLPVRTRRLSPSDSPPLSSACTLRYPGPRITFPRMRIRVHAGVTRGEFLARFRGMADSAEAARSWADIVEENAPTDNLSAHSEAGIIPATDS